MDLNALAMLAVLDGGGVGLDDIQEMVVDGDPEECMGARLD